MVQGRCWPCWESSRGAGCGGGCQSEVRQSALKTTQVQRMEVWRYLKVPSRHEICRKLRPSRTTSWMRPKLNSRVAEGAAFGNERRP